MVLSCSCEKTLQKSCPNISGREPAHCISLMTAAPLHSTQRRHMRKYQPIIALVGLLWSCRAVSWASWLASAFALVGDPDKSIWRGYRAATGANESINWTNRANIFRALTAFLLIFCHRDGSDTEGSLMVGRWATNKPSHRVGSYRCSISVVKNVDETTARGGVSDERDDRPCFRQGSHDVLTLFPPRMMNLPPPFLLLPRWSFPVKLAVLIPSLVVLVIAMLWFLPLTVAADLNRPFVHCLEAIVQIGGGNGLLLASFVCLVCSFVPCCDPRQGENTRFKTPRRRCAVTSLLDDDIVPSRVCQ